MTDWRALAWGAYDWQRRYRVYISLPCSIGDCFLLSSKLNFLLTEFSSKSLSARSLYSMGDGEAQWMGSIKTGIQRPTQVVTLHTHIDGSRPFAYDAQSMAMLSQLETCKIAFLRHPSRVSEFVESWTMGYRQMNRLFDSENSEKTESYNMMTANLPNDEWVMWVCAVCRDAWIGNVSTQIWIWSWNRANMEKRKII